MIRRNVEVQGRLLDELFDFASLGCEKVRLRLARVDAHSIVRAALETCRSMLDGAAMDVRLYFDASRSMLIADFVRLQQVIWNLITNAVKYSAKGSKLTISSADAPDGILELEFTDAGVGIEASLLPHVFEPFKQGARTGAEPMSGLGLGLYIARGMVQAQHGTLTAESAGAGHGSTFRLRLRVAPEL
jgi:signal transduction histidine kinase